MITLVLIGVSAVRLSRVRVVDPVEPSSRASDLPLALTTEPVARDQEAATERPVYPYSIIPGGAATVEALKAAIAADPVVRTHYANFDLPRTRLVRLTEPRVAHVSYRIGDEIFWTRRPLLLKVGETVFTDGVHYARSRCGNQLANSPGAVSAEEPAAIALDTPLPPRQGARTFPALALPGAEQTSVPAGATKSTPRATPQAAGTFQPSGGSRGADVVRRALPLDPHSLFPPQRDLNAAFNAAPPSSVRPGGIASVADPDVVVDDPPRAPEMFGDRDDPKSVPEPALLLMMLSGGLWLRLRSRRLAGAASVPP